ncbi:transposase [Streptomyces sp. NBC_00667]|uniref:transposase n=1 Tax=Streptomyces sp. NBC_00667 TaxID=2975803 RepID=UPI003FA7746F
MDSAVIRAAGGPFPRARRSRARMLRRRAEHQGQLGADGRARPLAFTVTTGQAGHVPAFETVMSRIRVPRSGPGRPRTLSVLADRAYSSRAIRNHLRRRGIRAVIPQPSGQGGHRLRRGRLGGRPPPPSTRRPTSSGTPSIAHQPPQTVARPGHTNRQARDRLLGRTPPRGHPQTRR